MAAVASLEEKARAYALDELFDSLLYRRMAERERNPENRELLLKMAEQERGHYEFWRKFCGDVSLAPRDHFRLRLLLYASRTLGKVFTIRFLERHEKSVVEEYRSILESGVLSQGDARVLERIIRDEEEHESSLAGQIDEFAVRHLGAIALGMSDAIIELSGVHAGFLGYTSSSVYTGVAGLIVGVSASLSMAAAAYLQSKQERGKSPASTAAVTGVMYMLTVLLLTAPFLAGLPIVTALAASLTLSLLVLAGFSFYSSVIAERGFLRDFIENAGVIFLVVAAGYIFGNAVKAYIGVPP